MYVINKLKHFFSKPASINVSGPFICPVCKKAGVGMNPLPVFYFAEFQKHQYVHNIFLTETINFEHYTCKNCGASDRDRLYALYLDKFLNGKQNVHLLDIAPAIALAEFIRSYPQVKYRSMDLNMEGVDDHLDITNMHVYKDEQFDFFMCSHVLEHIPDDVKAMQELYRVLKVGGKGIAMVPINYGVTNTLESPSITSVSDKWKYFGQDDHVRQYAKQEFIDRLESVGFKVEQLDKHYFGEQSFTEHAIFPTSTLYIVNK
jgi:SAM-dependent methyltransferase